MSGENSTSMPAAATTSEHSANDRQPQPTSPTTQTDTTDRSNGSGAEDSGDEEAIQVDIHDYGPGSDLLDYLVDLARYGDLDELKGFFDSVGAQLPDDDDDGRASVGAGEPGARVSRKWQEYRRAVLSQDDDRDCTLLHYASANGHADVVRYILSSFVTSPTSISGDEETAAVAALRRVLNRQNDGGNTALHWACLNGHLACAKLLADPSSQLYPSTGAPAPAAAAAKAEDGGDRGKKPENAAAQPATNAAHVGTVLSTDTSLRNRARRTAMDEAEANKQEDIVLYLLALEMHREKLAGVYDADGKPTAEAVTGDESGSGDAEEAEDEVKVSAGTI